jgi:hypothetical protein
MLKVQLSKKNIRFISCNHLWCYLHILLQTNRNIIDLLWQYVSTCQIMKFNKLRFNTEFTNWQRSIPMEQHRKRPTLTKYFFRKAFQQFHSAKSSHQFNLHSLKSFSLPKEIPTQTNDSLSCRQQKIKPEDSDLTYLVY